MAHAGAVRSGRLRDQHRRARRRPRPRPRRRRLPCRPRRQRDRDHAAVERRQLGRLGLPADRLLRRRRALRQALGFPGARRRLPPARHRRHRRRGLWPHRRGFPLLRRLYAAAVPREPVHGTVRQGLFQQLRQEHRFQPRSSRATTSSPSTTTGSRSTTSTASATTACRTTGTGPSASATPVSSTRPTSSPRRRSPQAQPYWSRFDARPGRPLAPRSSAPSSSRIPKASCARRYSNSTWQNRTFDAARVGRARRPRPAVRPRTVPRPVRLPGAGDRRNGDAIPKTALQYIENHDHERFVCNFGLDNPDEAGNPLFLRGRPRPLVHAAALPDRAADEQRHPDALAGRGIRRELLPAGLRRRARALLRPLRWDYFYDDAGTLHRRARAQAPAHPPQRAASIRHGTLFLLQRLGSLSAARRAAVRPHTRARAIRWWP